MILISHRGNINGPTPERENSQEYINAALSLGYDVEVDLWKIDKNLYLGHDTPQYQTNITWINDRAHRLWVHCKNTEAMSFLNQFHYDFNYFWHEEDTVTLTSKKFIWAYPGKQPIKNSIAVMPETTNDNIEECIGICSDYIQKYEK